MTDPRPTLAEGVTLVEGGQPITPATFNYAAKALNRQAGVSGPRQITGEPRLRRQGVGATGTGFAIITGLGDDTNLWVMIRNVTLNEAADGYDIGLEDTIAMTPPDMRDNEKYFGRFLVEAPFPGTLTESTIRVMKTSLVNGVLYVEQTRRDRGVPFSSEDERTDCGTENLP